jgi:hypothetical protein
VVRVARVCVCVLEWHVCVCVSYLYRVGHIVGVFTCVGVCVGGCVCSYVFMCIFINVGQLLCVCLYTMSQLSRSSYVNICVWAYKYVRILIL